MTPRSFFFDKNTNWLYKPITETRTKLPDFSVYNIMRQCLLRWKFKNAEVHMRGPDLRTDLTEIFKDTGVENIVVVVYPFCIHRTSIVLPDANITFRRHENQVIDTMMCDIRLKKLRARKVTIESVSVTIVGDNKEIKTVESSDQATGETADKNRRGPKKPFREHAQFCVDKLVFVPGNSKVDLRELFTRIIIAVPHIKNYDEMMPYFEKYISVREIVQRTTRVDQENGMPQIVKQNLTKRKLISAWLEQLDLQGTTYNDFSTLDNYGPPERRNV